jgi:hypothetical protein
VRLRGVCLVPGLPAFRRGDGAAGGRRIDDELGAACIAVVAIGLPDGAFLAGYYGYMEAIRATIVIRNWSPDYEPWHMTMGVVIGIMSALYVASIVRRWIGPIIGAKPAVPATSAREPIRSIPEHRRVSTRG